MQTLAFPTSEPLLARVREWVEGSVQETLDAADRFLTLTHRDFVLKEPTVEALREHRLATRLLLGMTRYMLAEVQDPDFPNRTLARQLAIRVRQMDDYYQLLHNPMPEAEADALLAKAFPDAPRA